MDRLTGRDKGNAYILKCFEGDGCEDMDTTRCDCCEHDFAICDRLAAYEDTGLTPEEVNRLRAQLAESQARERAAVEDIKHLVFSCANDPLDLCGEVCANNDGICQRGAAAGFTDKCHGFDWRGPQEAEKGEAK